ncbi:unnamed protein product [Dovyalis caffra]|uniref:Uncharacterized protein n=1 Tax=Dovyalis caffra TaxID=77055 RepID=A0AAV1R8E1_9ROSI|nr:unnamed protein product [Dovyalis caffra]
MGFRARGEISIDRTWRCGLRREWNRGSEGDSLDAATGGSLAYLVGSPGEVGRRLHWIPGRRSRDGLQSGPDRGLRSYFLVNQAREAHLEHKEDENLDIYRINMINHAQLKNKEALSLLLWVTYFVRSRLLRYDLPSSSYRSYSRFIPIRCYDVPYSNSGDSRRSLALFTSECYYWTDLLVGNVLHFR